MNLEESVYHYRVFWSLMPLSDISSWFEESQWDSNHGLIQGRTRIEHLVSVRERKEETPLYIQEKYEGRFPVWCLLERMPEYCSFITCSENTGKILNPFISSIDAKYRWSMTFAFGLRHYKPTDNDRQHQDKLCVAFMEMLVFCSLSTSAYFCKLSKAWK